MNETPIHDLSPLGRARREAMLDQLTLMMRRRRHARTRRRQIVTAFIALVGLSAALRRGLVGDPRRPHLPELAQRLPLHSGAAPASHDAVPRCVVVRVDTDPAIVDRLRARPAGRVVLLDDRELLNTLVAIKRPAGLIQYAGDIRLSAAVTDADLRLKQ